MMVSSLASPCYPRSRLLLLLAGRSSSDQGFTMFEVLIALMMSFLFLAGTLNAMVISAVFQVKAERQAQASYWIQEDLEELRATAASIACNSSLTSQNSVTDTTYVTTLRGSAVVQGTPTTQNLNLYGKVVSGVAQWAYDTSAPSGYSLIQSNIGRRTIQEAKTKEIVGKTYQLTRLFDVFNGTLGPFTVGALTNQSNPYSGQIAYLAYRIGEDHDANPSASDTDNDGIVDDSNGLTATLYTEVLPNAVLETCP